MKHTELQEPLYKARLVIRGFADSNDYEISEIYAPIVSFADIKVLLVFAVKFKFIIQ